MGSHVVGTVPRRAAYDGIDLAPIRRDVSSVDVVGWPAVLDIGTNLFQPFTGRDNQNCAEYFRQESIGLEVLQGTIDRARFLVVLDPSQEYDVPGHGGLGAGRPEILPLEKPRANLDKDLPVVDDRPLVRAPAAGLFFCTFPLHLLFFLLFFIYLFYCSYRPH